MLRLRFSILFISAAFAACVGDDNVRPDGGGDATTSDVVTSDSGGDDAGDAGDAAVTCAKPVFTTKITVVNTINAPGDQQTSFYQTQSQLFVYLTRDVPDSGQGLDIYTSSRISKSVAYGTATRLDAIDSDAGADDFNAVITWDGTELFFARSNAPKFSAVWLSLVSDAGYSTPAKLNANINGAAYDRVEPTWINEASTRMYLNVTAADGGSDYDIYFASRSGPGQGFSPAVRSSLSTTANEKNAIVTGDDLTLYFASDRAGGVGGYDTYVATRPDTASNFGTPTLVAEVSTTSDDIPVWISSDGCTMFLTDGTSIVGWGKF